MMATTETPPVPNRSRGRIPTTGPVCRSLLLAPGPDPGLTRAPRRGHHGPCRDRLRGHRQAAVAILRGGKTMVKPR